MAAAIYLLCALTSLACTALLLRAWLQTRTHLLFWSAICFAGLTASNVILVLDRLVFPQVDLSMPRLLVALLAMLVLVFGLVWERD